MRGTRQHRNTKTYVRAKGREVLDIEGGMELKDPAHRSVARFNSNGVFELYAKMDTQVPFNESAAKRYLAPRLKELFNPSRYLLIVECAVHTRRHQRNLGRYTNIEYYAICNKPEPSKVQQLQYIVREMIDHCKVSEEPRDEEE